MCRLCQRLSHTCVWLPVTVQKAKSVTINGIVQQRTYLVDHEKRMRPLAARGRESRPAAESAACAPSSPPSLPPSTASQSDASALSASPVPPSSPPGSLALVSEPSPLVVSSAHAAASPSRALSPVSLLPSLPSMTWAPEPSPLVVSTPQAAPSLSVSPPAQSVDRTGEDKHDCIENDDGDGDGDDDDELLLPMTEPEWGCFAPPPPSAEQVNDALQLIARRRKKRAQQLRSSASAPQRRQRATSIIRAFLLKPVQLKAGKQKLTHAQRALTFDDTAHWRSAHTIMCLNLHLRRFVTDKTTQDAVMPEVLAESALATLNDFRDALEQEDDEKLTRLHVLTHPAFRSWVLQRMYQMYASCCFVSAFRGIACLAPSSFAYAWVCSFRTQQNEARALKADKEKHALVLRVNGFSAYLLAS